MVEFTLGDVTLHIPDEVLTKSLRRSFEEGRYESSEAAAVARHLRRSDRFLDLGAGAGYLTALAVRTLRPRAVAGVEASPRMAQVAAANLERNGGLARRILSGAVVPADHAESHVEFTEAPSFWASSLMPRKTGKGQLHRVPALRFDALMARFDPTVLSMDIEGAELLLFGDTVPALPPALRLIILELHPSVYGKAGVKRLFDTLSSGGFGYCPVGSAGGTVVFERVHVGQRWAGAQD